MNFSSRILLNTAGLAAMCVSLTACAGAPAPCTEPANPSEVKETSAPVAAPSTTTAEQPAATSAAQAATAIAPTTTVAAPATEPTPAAHQPASQQAAATPQATTVVPATTADSSATAVLAPEERSIQPVDPYTAFPALATSTFDYADTLYKQGRVDEATAYLQRFRVIKPLWNQWEATADSMLNEFGKTNAERAKQFEPMVMEIQNMNRARSAYSLVAEVADSLIALAPGDSLVNFANQQKQVAYTNTLEKATKEKSTIQKLAVDQAKFAEAEQKAIEFQMRYRDFEDALKIQAMIDEIREMASSNDAAAAAYWQKNDPAAALSKAKELVEKSNFAEAKELLSKLKASTLRKEALEEYSKLADAYCNVQRKTTSQLFGKAQKQKDEAKKSQLLKEAIAPLDKCLGEYPEYSQKQKVIDNKKFLERELTK